MAFLDALLAKFISAIVDKVWKELEARLEVYFEMKSQIKKISSEASELKEELKNATTDAERIQILRKITDFQDRIGD